jgi:hypothetical protein
MKVSRVKAIASPEALKSPDPQVVDYGPEGRGRRPVRRRLIIVLILVAVLCSILYLSRTPQARTLYYRYKLLSYRADPRRVVWDDGAAKEQLFGKKPDYIWIQGQDDSYLYYSPWRSNRLLGNGDSFIYQVMWTPSGKTRIVQMRFGSKVVEKVGEKLTRIKRTIDLQVLEPPSISRPPRVVSQRMPFAQITYEPRHLQVFEGQPQPPDFTTCVMRYELQDMPGQAAFRFSDDDTLIVDSWSGPVAFQPVHDR